MTRCLTCKARLSGRAASTYSGDFCSEYCFSAYPANVRAALSRAPSSYEPQPPRETIERILERNRTILEAFGNWRKKAPVMDDIGALHWMQEKGFDFGYHTHVSRHLDGSTEMWCYEVGYRIEKNGRVEPLPM